MDITPDQLRKAREALGIGESTTLRQIRLAYRARWQEYHPDTSKGTERVDNERLAELKRSYDILIRYCEEYEISFDKKNAATHEYDHIMKFYDGWIGDIKKK